MSEIQRTKKELAFTKKKLQQQREGSQQEGAGHQKAAGNAANLSNELGNSLKLVETINMQKRVLETENEELKSRISEMLNDKTSNMQSALENVNSGDMLLQQQPY